MKKFLNVGTIAIFVLAFLTILMAIPLGQDWYETYQNDQGIVNSLEYGVIQAIEQADPSIYVWLVRVESGSVRVWVTWAPEVKDASIAGKKAILMTFLNAILPPLYNAYPDLDYYYIVTCAPAEATIIEAEGHILRGEQIWAITSQAAEAIAAGITYDELEALGADKLVELTPAFVFGGVSSVRITKRPSEHVYPW